MTPSKCRSLLLASVVCVTACHDQESVRPQAVTTTSVASARGEAAGQPVKFLGRWRRSSAPRGAPADEVGPVVVVTDDLAALWPSWGPDGADRPAPPDTKGAHVAVVWDGIGGLTVSGVEVSGGALVIVGVRVLPGDGCPALNDVGETTVIGLGGVDIPAKAGVGLPKIVQSAGAPC